MSTTGAAAVGAASGIATAGAASLRPSLTPRSTLHQALVTGIMATTGAVAGAAVGTLVRRGPLGGRVGPLLGTAVVVGSASLALARSRRNLQAHAEAHTEWGDSSGRPVLGAGAGVAAAAGLTLAATVASRGINRVADRLSQRFGGPRVLWAAAESAVLAGSTIVAGRALARRTKTHLIAEGKAADPALTAAPSNPYVSGGEESLVRYDTLSREGRRFVHWRVSRKELVEYGAEPAQEPLRIFVGIDSEATLSARVDLAMAELERLGAFDRKHLLAICPAGSGYANSVPVEALEIYSAGDCASVVLQYGVLPSMFSIDRIPDAADGYRLLLDRIRVRIEESPRRPQLHLYGESLGAHIAQVALTRTPDLVDEEDAAVEGIDSALFVGSPGGTELRDQLADNPHAVHVDRWEDLPAQPPADCQLWFLDHDADPVTRFERQLMRSQPHWLSRDPRGRNVPSDMSWVPIWTWQQVLLDVAYATQSQSGVFRSLGHDYRADLAPLVAAAYCPEQQSSAARVQQILTEREITRDKLLSQS